MLLLVASEMGNCLWDRGSCRQWNNLWSYWQDPSGARQERTAESGVFSQRAFGFSSCLLSSAETQCSSFGEGSESLKDGGQGQADLRLEKFHQHNILHAFEEHSCGWSAHYGKRQEDDSWALPQAKLLCNR